MIKYYLEKLWYYIKQPKLLLFRMLVQYPKLIKNDRIFVTLKWNLAMPYKLNLDNPQSFNEKLQWLKLYDHRPEYTQMVDKAAAKDYVSNIIGKEYIIPILGVYNKFDDVDFNSLPNRFVLKVTHDSGGVVICKDKMKLDKDKARAVLESREKNNYYVLEREWPYKDVEPRILCEEYMEDCATGELRDYKFFCFNGKVKCFKVDYGRFTAHHANYYDENLNILYFGETHYMPEYDKDLSLTPSVIKKMIKLAEMLSAGIPFIRVDFYDVNSNIYFGELTFYPSSARSLFTDIEWDYKLGSYLELPKVKRI